MGKCSMWVAKTLILVGITCLSQPENIVLAASLVISTWSSSQQFLATHLRFPPVWTILRWSEPGRMPGHGTQQRMAIFSRFQMIIGTRRWLGGFLDGGWLFWRLADKTFPQLPFEISEVYVDVIGPWRVQFYSSGWCGKNHSDQNFCMPSLLRKPNKHLTSTCCGNGVNGFGSRIANHLPIVGWSTDGGFQSMGIPPKSIFFGSKPS